MKRSALFLAAAGGGLRIRALPSTSAPVVGRIEEWSEVEIESPDATGAHGPYEAIDGRDGRWLRYENGWIFSGYLNPGGRVYYSATGADVPVYSSFMPDRSLLRRHPGAEPLRPETTDGSEVQYLLRTTADGAGDRWLAVDWTEKAWVREGDLRPGEPATAFCGGSGGRNCLPPELRRYLFGQRIAECSSDRLALYPEGEVYACPAIGRIGSWRPTADGAIIVELNRTQYRCGTAGESAGSSDALRRPSRFWLRRVDVDLLTLPTGERQNVRDWHMNRRNRGFLPVKADGTPLVQTVGGC